jgi:ankyrin repeat protein
MSNEGINALIEALDKENANEVDAGKVGDILAAYKGSIDFEKCNDDGKTPLQIAIEKGNLACVRLLLEAGAKANAAPANDWVDPALIQAIESRGYRVNPKIVALLLEHGADPNQARGDFIQKRPLLIAAERGYESIVVMLIEAGADVLQKDAQERTALYVAAEHGRTGIIRILAEEGAVIDKPGWIGRTPLEAAIWGNHRDAFDTLLELGADPFAASKSKWTLLMAAAYAGETGLLEPLVKMGFKVDDQNGNGDTALHCAAWSGHGDCADKLLAMGASKSIVNNKGKTPAQIAEDEGHIHVVRQLACHEMKIATEMKAGLKGGLNVSKPIQLKPAPA